MDSVMTATEVVNAVMTATAAQSVVLTMLDHAAAHVTTAPSVEVMAVALSETEEM